MLAAVSKALVELDAVALPGIGILITARMAWTYEAPNGLKSRPSAAPDILDQSLHPGMVAAFPVNLAAAIALEKHVVVFPGQR